MIGDVTRLQLPHLGCRLPDGYHFFIDPVTRKIPAYSYEYMAMVTGLPHFETSSISRARQMYTTSAYVRVHELLKKSGNPVTSLKSLMVLSGNVVTDPVTG